MELFLVEKLETFCDFKCFKTMMEKEIGMPIKCLRINRGGEFNCAEFNDFFKTTWSEKTIDHSLYPTTKWSGRTVLNLVRAMLTEKKVPKNLLPEAVRWTIHILIKSPTLARRGLERCISRLFKSFWMCGTCSYSRCQEKQT